VRGVGRTDLAGALALQVMAGLWLFAPCVAAIAQERRCTEEPARFAVGAIYSDELAERARRAAGAHSIRKVVPGEAYTMELREDRLNINVAPSGVVESVKCG